MSQRLSVRLMAPSKLPEGVGEGPVRKPSVSSRRESKYTAIFAADDGGIWHPWYRSRSRRMQKLQRSRWEAIGPSAIMCRSRERRIQAGSFSNPATSRAQQPALRAVFADLCSRMWQLSASALEHVLRTVG